MVTRLHRYIWGLVAATGDWPGIPGEHRKRRGRDLGAGYRAGSDSLGI
jgi:hypothetical protein